jgi:hypothetical protein
MDDLDRLLAESLHSAAEQAPSDGGLLNAVHQKSRRRHRQRIVTGLGSAAVLAVAVPFATVLLTGSGPDPDTVQVAPAASVPGTPSPRPSTSHPSAPRTPATRTPSSTKSTSGAASGSGTVVRLVHGYTAPTFPYTLPATSGMKAPVASMQDGNPIAFFEATELRHHSDVTVTVLRKKPVFTAAATSKTFVVRGHSATLRTGQEQPARKLTLFWKESATRWIQLATDDTYSPQQVVALADSLTAASIAVLPPFTLDLTPSGLAADTVTASTMSFRAADGHLVAVVLRKRQPLSAATDTVGRYQAQLTHSGGGATLSVDVTDWDATLELTVEPGLSLSDADLLRFAAGVHILNRSNPE